MPSVYSTFHAVGQGLFATGLIGFREDSWFSWVYDCGSTNYKSGLERRIEMLSATPHFRAAGSDTIDMVVLSHFDRDHINGLTRLLSDFRIDTLVLPLIPLWQRLVLMFSVSGYVSKEVSSFLIDPVDSIRRRFGQRIGRIFLVPPSNGEDDFIADDDGSDGPPPNKDFYESEGNGRPIKLQVYGRWRQLAQYGNASGPLTYELSRGARLSPYPEWEFIPYNDAWAAKKVDKPFIEEAAKLRDALLGTHGASEVQRKEALKKLKRHYTARFKSSAARNRISLFLYAGTVWSQFERSSAILGLFPLASPVSPLSFLPAEYQYFYSQSAPSVELDLFRSNGFLYCGDGDLSSRKKWKDLENYLSRHRVRRLAILQVMHHGSKYNWYAGLADDFSVPIAIFSADPAYKHGHPHSCVEQDFNASGLSFITAKTLTFSTAHYFY